MAKSFLLTNEKTGTRQGLRCSCDIRHAQYHSQWKIAYGRNTNLGSV